MTKQKIVATEYLGEFKCLIQGLLDEGWKVIPGTVQVGIAEVNEIKEECYMAFLEKYIPDIAEKV